MYLDRMLADPKFLDLYESTAMRHAPSPKSDHCIMVVQIRSSADLQTSARPHQFMYEDAWRREDSYMQAVTEGWAGRLALEPMVSSA